MTVTIEGGCQCGAVNFTVESATPVPYQRCYCTICRVSAGGGGYSVNIGAITETLSVDNWEGMDSFQARLDTGGHSGAERYYCRACGTQLWLFDERWPELVHPIAGVIRTPLRAPPSITHIFMGEKPDWVKAEVSEGDQVFDSYPDVSLVDWHKAQGVYAG
ncbi:GFA family protein [Maritimibacter sp. DP1N21-5]|uniref:GFA family protein n=1 Tax=Maritimibacter sp. DP1N21-5 TaxID=2836867 RepID=UPI001C495F2F|nr:GFA family protein [Maritimibacter sp. DP1N21-5]MBV7408521.1 GFA family protein [Maritimibacter sp. DP1N21-5]